MTQTGGIPGDFAVVLAAAGSGTRFGSGEESGRKQFMELNGRPLIAYSLDIFSSLSEIGTICIVAPGEELETVEELVGAWSEGCSRVAGGELELSILAGGDSRQESVRNGVEALSEGSRWILVHDAARPLLDPGDVRHLMEAVREHGAAALGYPATDSVKIEAAGISERGLDRDHIWCVQTPQGASVENFSAAYSHARGGEQHTDELALLESAGISARLVEGSRENIKVTVPGDDELARFYLSRRG